jgi:hypothetical protein
LIFSLLFVQPQWRTLFAESRSIRIITWNNCESKNGTIPVARNEEVTLFVIVALL